MCDLVRCAIWEQYKPEPPERGDGLVINVNVCHVCDLRSEFSLLSGHLSSVYGFPRGVRGVRGGHLLTTLLCLTCYHESPGSALGECSVRIVRMFVVAGSGL